MLCHEVEMGYGITMRNRTINLVTISIGAAAGLYSVAVAEGALVPVWSFFLDGMIQHFLSMRIQKTLHSAVWARDFLKPKVIIVRENNHFVFLFVSSAP